MGARLARLAADRAISGSIASTDFVHPHAQTGNLRPVVHDDILGVRQMVWTPARTKASISSGYLMAMISDCMVYPVLK
jgi:hypothetical protein